MSAIRKNARAWSRMIRLGAISIGQALSDSRIAVFRRDLGRLGRDVADANNDPRLLDLLRARAGVLAARVRLETAKTILRAAEVDEIRRQREKEPNA